MEPQSATTSGPSSDSQSVPSIHHHIPWRRDGRLQCTKPQGKLPTRKKEQRDPTTGSENIQQLQEKLTQEQINHYVKIQQRYFENQPSNLHTTTQPDIQEIQQKMPHTTSKPTQEQTKEGRNTNQTKHAPLEILYQIHNPTQHHTKPNNTKHKTQHKSN